MDENKSIKILLLHETRIDTLTSEIQKDAYIDLGGKPEYLDADSAYTAVREMNEESKNMFIEEAGMILQKIREGKAVTITTHGKKPYYFYFVEVKYKPVNSNRVEWVDLIDLLKVTDNEFNGYMISNRLFQMLETPGARKKLALI